MGIEEIVGDVGVAIEAFTTLGGAAIPCKMFWKIPGSVVADVCLEGE